MRQQPWNNVDALGRIWWAGRLIDRYIGEWRNEAGHSLDVRKVDDETCLVTFVDADHGQPIRRPWCALKPTIDMVGKYDPMYGPDLVVDLGGAREGFALHLTFEAAYELDSAQRDALVPGLSRYQEDDDLDQYYRFFMPLMHYTKK